MGIIGILHEQAKARSTFDESTKRAILVRDNYACKNCGSNQIHSIHHLLKNTKVNIKNYGNAIIQNSENGCPVCFNCHQNHTLWDKPLIAKLEEKYKDVYNSNSKIKIKELK